MPSARPPSVASRIADSAPLLIAHRGNSSQAPENTLPAFLSAVELGADFVELDYVHSADGVPVVFHDVLLDRTTDAAARWTPTQHGTPLAWKTLAELKQLDAGAWFAPQFAGTRISTLGEVLDEVASDAAVMIERKTGDAATLVDVLRRHDALDRVVVLAFDWHFVAEMRARAPELPLGILGMGPLKPSYLQLAEAISASVIGWQQESLAEHDLGAIHQRRLQAWAWTVDDSSRARHLLAAGLDGLITNRPGEMQTLMR